MFIMHKNKHNKEYQPINLKNINFTVFSLSLTFTEQGISVTQLEKTDR